MPRSSHRRDKPIILLFKKPGRTASTTRIEADTLCTLFSSAICHWISWSAGPLFHIHAQKTLIDGMWAHDVIIQIEQIMTFSEGMPRKPFLLQLPFYTVQLWYDSSMQKGIIYVEPSIYKISMNSF